MTGFSFASKTLEKIDSWINLMNKSIKTLSKSGI